MMQMDKLTYTDYEDHQHEIRTLRIQWKRCINQFTEMSEIWLTNTGRDKALGTTLERTEDNLVLKGKSFEKDFTVRLTQTTVKGQCYGRVLVLSPNAVTGETEAVTSFLLDEEGNFADPDGKKVATPQQINALSYVLLCEVVLRLASHN